MTEEYKSPPKRTKRPRRRAETPEREENQLVNLAVELAEQQLREGTASAQVISHFLKAGSTREQLEQQRLRAENDLLRAKIESLASQARIEDLYAKALDAMRSYSGNKVDDPDD